MGLFFCVWIVLEIWKKTEMAAVRDPAGDVNATCATIFSEIYLQLDNMWVCVRKLISIPMSQ